MTYTKLFTLHDLHKTFITWLAEGPLYRMTCTESFTLHDLQKGVYIAWKKNKYIGVYLLYLILMCDEGSGERDHRAATATLPLISPDKMTSIKQPLLESTSQTTGHQRALRQRTHTRQFHKGQFHKGRSAPLRLAVSAWPHSKTNTSPVTSRQPAIHPPSIYSHSTSSSLSGFHQRYIYYTVPQHTHTFVS